MAKFNEYTQKATPEDADTLMIYDAASKTNKLSPFSGIWNWMVNKLTNAVINNLQTSNKTVVGALNELNSNRLKPFYKGMITNGLVTVPLVSGLYLVSTYRSGGYKISSLSIVNIQAQDGSFIETLAKGVDYDNTIEMKYTDSSISFQYKIGLSGGCTIVIFELA